MAQKVYTYIVNEQRNWRLRRCKKVSDYVEEMPQSHTVNQPTGHEEETQNNTTRKRHRTISLCYVTDCAVSLPR